MKLALLTATLILAAPATALAAYSGSETQSSGTVSATLTYTASDTAITNEMVITRAGVEAFRGIVGGGDCGQETLSCAPAAALFGPPSQSLAVTDLDNDGDAEVIVDFYTGGAHCCTISEIRRWNGSAYVQTSRYWGNSGYVIKSVAGSKQPHFFTQDDRFAYAFASYAWSGMPLRIVTFTNGKWRTVTKSFKPLIQKNAAEQWKAFKDAQKQYGEPRGPAAAWAADQYLLGKRKSALKTLRAEAKKGHLRGEPGTAKSFITKLDRQLHQWGY